MSCNESPCLTCKRTKEPHRCWDKHCVTWQKWFLEKWEEINGFYRNYQEQKAVAKDGK